MLLPEIMEEISERTDGVPLFVEELTMAVVESGARAIAGALADQSQRISVTELRSQFVSHERTAKPGTQNDHIRHCPTPSGLARAFQPPFGCRHDALTA